MGPLWITSLFPPWRIKYDVVDVLSVCLSVTLIYCGQTVAYFSYCSAELLFIDMEVHMEDSF